MNYKDMSITELEAKQAKVVNWMMEFGRSHPRYHEAGRAITEITREIIRRTGDITLEAKKTANLINWSKDFQDPLIKQIQETLI